tara:strand:+ start:2737 stop:2997 length:261 start_codon:yes stop_codon:yes gene_type:complete
MIGFRVRITSAQQTNSPILRGIDMFDNWTYVEWMLLIYNIIAVIVVVWFLRKKIKSKLHEVELRQNQQTKRRREQAKLNSQENEKK